MFALQSGQFDGADVTESGRLPMWLAPMCLSPIWLSPIWLSPICQYLFLICSDRKHFDPIDSCSVPYNVSTSTSRSKAHEKANNNKKIDLYQ